MEDMYGQISGLQLEYNQLEQIRSLNPDNFLPADEVRFQTLREKLELPEPEESFDMGRMLGNTISGFLRGFTTYPTEGNQKTTADRIAYSLGNLAGFIGIIPGPGLLGKAGARAVGSVIGRRTLAMNAKTLKLKSVPMWVGDRFISGIEAAGKSQAGIAVNTFMGERMADIVKGGLHIGAASAASSWSEGVDEMMKSFVMGGLEGSGYRWLAGSQNISKALKGAGIESEQGHAAVRAIASSIYTGLPNTLAGEPLEYQVYEYLLGAYFGHTELPYKVRKAGEIIQAKVKSHPEMATALLGHPERHVEGWNKLDPEVQQEVRDQSIMMFGRQMLNPGSGESNEYALAFGQKIAEAMEKNEGAELEGIIRNVSDEILKEKEAVGSVLSEVKTAIREQTGEEISGVNLAELKQRHQQMLDEHQVAGSVMYSLQELVSKSSEGKSFDEQLGAVDRIATMIGTSEGGLEGWKNVENVIKGELPNAKPEELREIQYKWLMAGASYEMPSYVLHLDNRSIEGMGNSYERQQDRQAGDIVNELNVSVAGGKDVPVELNKESITWNLGLETALNLHNKNVPDDARLTRKEFLSANPDSRHRVRYITGFVDSSKMFTEHQNRMDHEELKESIDTTFAKIKGAKTKKEKRELKKELQLLQERRSELTELDDSNLSTSQRPISAEDIFGTPGSRHSLEEGRLIPDTHDEFIADIKKDKGVWIQYDTFLSQDALHDARQDSIQLHKDKGLEYPFDTTGAFDRGEGKYGSSFSGEEVGYLHRIAMDVEMNGGIKLTDRYSDQQRSELHESGVISTEDSNGHFKNPVEKVKRGQLVYDMGLPVPRLNDPENPRADIDRTILVSLSGNPHSEFDPMYRSGTNQAEIHGAQEDGYTKTTPKALARLAERTGLEPGLGAYKTAITGTNKEGAFLQKHKEDAMGEAEGQFWEALDIDKISSVDATKYRGNRHVYEMRHTPEGITLDGHLITDISSMEKAGIEVHDIPVEWTRINKGATITKELSTHDQPLYAQMDSKVSMADHPEIATEMDLRMQRELYGHTDSNSKRALIELNGKGDIDRPEMLKSVKLDELSVSEIAKVLYTNHYDNDVYDAVIRQLMNETATEGQDGMVSDSLQDAVKFKNNGRQVFSLGDESGPLVLSRAIMTRPENRNLLDRVLKDYAFDRLLRPKQPYSTKSAFSPMDGYAYQHLQNNGYSNTRTLGVRSVYLGDGYKTFKVPVGESRQEFTLEEVFNTYVGRTGAFPEGLKHDGKKKLKVSKELSSFSDAELLRALEPTMLRAPVDAAQVIQNVFLGGFSGSPGHTVRMHGEMMERMSGADLDNDSGVLYFDLPEFRRAIAEKTKESLYNKDGYFEPVVNDASTKRWAFESRPAGEKELSFHPSDAFSGIGIEQAGINARSGMENLGPSLNLTDYVESILNNNTSLQGKDRHGRVYSEIHFRPEARASFAKKKTEIVNLSADASGLDIFLSKQGSEAKIILESIGSVDIKGVKHNLKKNYTPEEAYRAINTDKSPEKSAFLTFKKEIGYATRANRERREAKSLFDLKLRTDWKGTPLPYLLGSNKLVQAMTSLKDSRVNWGTVNYDKAAAETYRAIRDNPVIAEALGLSPNAADIHTFTDPGRYTGDINAKKEEALAKREKRDPDPNRFDLSRSELLQQDMSVVASLRTAMDFKGEISDTRVMEIGTEIREMKREFAKHKVMMKQVDHYGDDVVLEQMKQTAQEHYDALDTSEKKWAEVNWISSINRQDPFEVFAPKEIREQKKAFIENMASRGMDRAQASKMFVQPTKKELSKLWKQSNASQFPWTLPFISNKVKTQYYRNLQRLADVIPREGFSGDSENNISSFLLSASDPARATVDLGKIKEEFSIDESSGNIDAAIETAAEFMDQHLSDHSYSKGQTLRLNFHNDNLKKLESKKRALDWAQKAKEVEVDIDAPTLKRMEVVLERLYDMNPETLANIDALFEGVIAQSKDSQTGRSLSASTKQEVLYFVRSIEQLLPGRNGIPAETEKLKRKKIGVRPIHHFYSPDAINETLLPFDFKAFKVKRPVVTNIGGRLGMVVKEVHIPMSHLGVMHSLFDKTDRALQNMKATISDNQGKDIYDMLGTSVVDGNKKRSREIWDLASSIHGRYADELSEIRYHSDAQTYGLDKKTGLLLGEESFLLGGKEVSGDALLKSYLEFFRSQDGVEGKSWQKYVYSNDLQNEFDKLYPGTVNAVRNSSHKEINVHLFNKHTSKLLHADKFAMIGHELLSRVQQQKMINNTHISARSFARSLGLKKIPKDIPEQNIIDYIKSKTGISPSGEHGFAKSDFTNNGDNLNLFYDVIYSKGSRFIDWSNGQNIMTPLEHYVPRNDWAPEMEKKAFERKMIEISSLRAKDQIQAELVLKSKHERQVAGVKQNMVEIRDNLLDNAIVITEADFEINNNSYNPNVLQERSGQLPGWSQTPESWVKYDNAMADGYWRQVQSLTTSAVIDSFQRNNHSEFLNKDAWTKFMKIAQSNILGHPSIYPEEWINDPELSIKGNLYNGLTDKWWIEKLNKMGFKAFQKPTITEDSFKKYMEEARDREVRRHERDFKKDFEAARGLIESKSGAVKMSGRNEYVSEFANRIIDLGTNRDTANTFNKANKVSRKDSRGVYDYGDVVWINFPNKLVSDATNNSKSKNKLASDYIKQILSAKEQGVTEFISALPDNKNERDIRSNVIRRLKKEGAKVKGRSDKGKNYFEIRFTPDPVEIPKRNAPTEYADNNLTVKEVEDLRKAYRQDMANNIASISRTEGKWELITLLAHTKSYVNNIIGGSSNTAMSSGLEWFRKSGNLSFLRDHVNKDWVSWDDVHKFVDEHGGIDSWISQEIQKPDQMDPGEWTAFLGDFKALIRNKKDFSLKDTANLVKRYKISDRIVNLTAWPMQASELMVRRKAWLSHYLKARHSFGTINNGVPPPLTDSWAISMANKGVAATQFLYNASNRQAFARTHMGRVFHRFHRYGWESARLRKQVARDAAMLGALPGSPEHDRIRRFATGDMMMLSLATLFPATMFENNLPQPLGWLQDMTDWFFGENEERERAFFGTMPYPLNPLNAVSAPVLRVPGAIFGALLTGDWERFGEYHAWTWFPGGRMARDVGITLDSPVLAVERLTGLPLHRINQAVQKQKKLNEELE